MTRPFEIFGEFLKLGLTSFGGPSAHIAYFRERFVAGKSWVTEAEYAAFVALTQFLPGPGSSQMGMAIGYKKGGVAGSVAAFLGFTLPSAVIMTLFALGVMRFGSLQSGEAGWIRALQIAVVAVIANAVASMARSLCRGRLLSLVALVSAGVVLGIESTWTQVGVIAGGALAGWIFLRGRHGGAAEQSGSSGARPALHLGSIAFATLCLVVFTLLLVAVPWANRSDHPLVQAFGGMYRSGALVFGGGHVVLPLLSQETVDTGWLTDAEFSAGYGAAQALPGPIFAISSYIGALVRSPGGPWLSAVICTIGIFLPGWLLLMGTLPFWEKLREIGSLRNALAGTNAAVVGLLGAALYDPVWTKAIRGPGDVVFLLGVAAALLVLKWPPWLVVILSGICGAFLM